MIPQFKNHREHCAHLRSAAIQASDPAAAIARSLSPADFAASDRVFVVGTGKAGTAMMQAAAAKLGDKLTKGIMSVPTPPSYMVPKVTFFKGGHPLPTEASFAAGKAIADLLAQTTDQDLVIALISGGGSALLELPQAGIRLEDLQKTNDLLLKSGAAIHQVNTIRSLLSQLKSGGLLRLAYPARVLGLILSDVVGSAPETIASGPTIPKSGAPLDALAILEKHNLLSSLPAAVLKHIKTYSDQVSESTAPVENRIIGSNLLACRAAQEAAQKMGFQTLFLGDDWQGQARDTGRRFAEQLIEYKDMVPACFIAGGETTVIVRGSGKGGRNQEAALAAALRIRDHKNMVVNTFATDGIDGPTYAAGAIVTGETIARAQALNLDPQQFLDDNNAFAFFKALSDLIVTGATGTNVNDLLFGLKY
jgi:glycerate 2-kinase